MRVTPIILAGGMGERLWPLSRDNLPKPFAVTGTLGRSLFQETLLRVAESERFTRPVILCHVAHRFLALEQLRALGLTNVDILLEPEAKNTAPALALATQHCLSDATLSQQMLALPSDHHFEDAAAFIEAVARAVHCVENGLIVTFGALPTHAQPSYGYITRGEPVASASGAYHVARFIEKPSVSEAEKLVSQGDCYWNAGIFFAHAETFRRELMAHAPSLWTTSAAAYQTASRNAHTYHIPAQAWESMPSQPFDKAVMERTNHAAVIPFTCGWSDLGGWESLLASGYVSTPFPEPVLIDCQDTLVYTADTCVAAAGVSNLAIIAAHGAVMVCPRSALANVKSLVAELRARQPQSMLEQALHYRDWGFFKVLEANKDYQVTHLCVRPGQEMTLSEYTDERRYWVVVQGQATALDANETATLLHPNATLQIEANAPLRLRNTSQEDLVIIETRTRTLR